MEFLDKLKSKTFAFDKTLRDDKKDYRTMGVLHFFFWMVGILITINLGETMQKVSHYLEYSNPGGFKPWLLNPMILLGNVAGLAVFAVVLFEITRQPAYRSRALIRYSLIGVVIARVSIQLIGYEAR